jgi:hypothetical protein
VILGYDPTIPSWGYNGNARRYWDFLYGGKLERIERQIHHYGSALNAVPLFDAYRANPQDLHLLRVAYGGLMGSLTNIDQEGFGAAAFHSWPDQMRFDAITGDYGMGFFGHAYATASYLVDDPTFGWLGFGGVVSQSRDVIRIEPRDSGRSRLFIGPARLWLTLEAGKIESAEYSPGDGMLLLRLAPADAYTRAARLSVETTSPERARYAPAGVSLERGLYTISLSAHATLVTLTPSHPSASSSTRRFQAVRAHRRRPDGFQHYLGGGRGQPIVARDDAEGIHRARQLYGQQGKHSVRGVVARHIGRDDRNEIALLQHLRHEEE